MASKFVITDSAAFPPIFQTQYFLVSNGSSRFYSKISFVCTDLEQIFSLNIIQQSEVRSYCKYCTLAETIFWDLAKVPKICAFVSQYLKGHAAYCIIYNKKSFTFL